MPNASPAPSAAVMLLPAVLASTTYRLRHKPAQRLSGSGLKSIPYGQKIEAVEKRGVVSAGVACRVASATFLGGPSRIGWHGGRTNWARILAYGDRLAQSGADLAAGGGGLRARREAEETHDRPARPGMLSHIAPCAAIVETRASRAELRCWDA